MINSTEINKYSIDILICLLPLFFYDMWNSSVVKRKENSVWCLVPFPVLILEINKNANETAKKMKKIPTKKGNLSVLANLTPKNKKEKRKENSEGCTLCIKILIRACEKKEERERDSK